MKMARVNLSPSGDECSTPQPDDAACQGDLIYWIFSNCNQYTADQKGMGFRP